ncbi:uncharacterized protein EV422DRAFT_520172 [Fimicolochytrium jonesii]|uniref:uncharacterized protein n=1 Tax=Fimicolochytrium jonesii TaxID=1396493 RepID=UPI0022FE5BE2|nr:uncharacterized protein EV422DRAFT_520172 [Fimicolochytrium jonesii]KAI8824458.1 hypothetical protein EV422DRAFT_520172 [Fimicolochytrium jonesii]
MCPIRGFSLESIVLQLFQYQLDIVVWWPLLGPHPLKHLGGFSYLAMDRFGIENIVQIVSEVIPKARRFSVLSEYELLDLWRELMGFVESALAGKGHRQQSLILPGYGAFHVRKAQNKGPAGGHRYIPYFIPSRGWAKVRGYQVTQPPSTLDGAPPPDPFNFSACALHSGVPRETLEVGIKDITHGVIRVIKRGATVVLPFYGIGRLVFKEGNLRFSFSADFLTKLNGSDQTREGKPALGQGVSTSAADTQQPAQSTDAKDQSASAESETTSAQKADPKSDPSSDKDILVPKPPSDPASAVQSRPASASSRAPSNPEDLHVISRGYLKKTESPPIPPVPTAPPAPPSPAPEEKAVGSRLLAVGKLDKQGLLEFSVKSVGTHSHTHSGDRQWSDASCPVCRSNKIPPLELRHSKARREKEQDRLLLQLSLDLDQDFLCRAKELEWAKKARAMSDAQFNRNTAAEMAAQQKQAARVLPVNNIFENRDPGAEPPESAHRIATILREQMVSKQIQKAHDRLHQQYQNEVLNQKLIEDIRKSEIEAHLDKLRKRAHQQEALADQIRHKQQRAAAGRASGGSGEAPVADVDSNPLPNPMARSESLMILYQKQKAKQLYQEQLALVRQKQEHERRLADGERQLALRKLEASKDELSQDVGNTKRQKFEMRRSLEHFWDQQIALKRKLQAQAAAQGVC